ncbi:SH2 domain-containing protein B [Ziziphus jujuba]|uniref:SH2 domain-containing protein B n=1 Tax=Ziziphus jujuba TaxID=326968 RepID=A0A6P3ZWI4_ZIZJJ|nr:SH2 domain-containing protein B [Ziziphus jujuba]
MVNEAVVENEDYSLLEDLRLEIEIDEKEGSFSLCFWLYLPNSTTFPATIIHQENPDGKVAPFLVLNEKKKVMLLPLFPLHKEVLNDSNPASLGEIPHALMDAELPTEKWVHFGCEVSNNFLRLHIDGEMVGEKPLSSLLKEDSTSSVLRKINLVSRGGDGNCVLGYIKNLKVLSLTSSIKEHYAKDPPLQLSIDNSSTTEIEEGLDGIWSIVGGKASCRRNFSLDVVSLDASGQPISKEMEVVASLTYADNGAPVEQTSDGEAPLLASFDGIEFDSCDRPTKLLHGRASFRLKISQLSSKCDNRLFRIRFDVRKMEEYPFLKALSPPIRCISRNRNPRVSSNTWKRSSSDVHPTGISQSFVLDEDNLELQHNSLREAKPSSLSKCMRSGQDRISATLRGDPPLEPLDEECNSHAWTANQVENAFVTSSVRRSENIEEADDSLSYSESVEEKNSTLKNTSSNRNQMSDMSIFKYSLAGLAERSLLLKEIANSASNEEILDFADKVSLYSGCSHHRNQIIMAKRLIEEGRKAWNLISQNNHHVQWESMVFEIEEQFMKIAGCSSRSLSQQDFELLRRIAGCQEYVAQENFEQMWCWLYPVAFTLSREPINAMWSCTTPKWIEGFITKEEAESSLQGPRGLQDPGTFILRFPTSRSWPHPDAGTLVVTYIGSDYTIHHRLLSPDHAYSSAERDEEVQSLQDMLLAEPELSRLGRIIRRQCAC